MNQDAPQMGKRVKPEPQQQPLAQQPKNFSQPLSEGGQPVAQNKADQNKVIQQNHQGLPFENKAM